MEFELRIGSPVMAGAAVRPLLSMGMPITSLRWSWDQAGPAGASVSFQPRRAAPVVGSLPDPIDVPLRGHVEIMSGGRVIWDGFVRTRERGPGGSVTAITAVGYAQSLGDRWWTRSDEALLTGRTSGAVLAIAIRELTPWLSPGVIGDQWIDPYVNHSGGMNDFTRMTVAQIADQIRQTGDARGHEVWVSCMPGRQVWLLPRVAPSEPDYRVAFDHRIQRWTESDEGMAATVAVERGTASSGTLGPTATTATFLSDRGFAPSVIIAAGDITADAALALRNAELRKRSVPRLSATIGVTKDSPTWLSNRYGLPVPYWMPRTGEWVGVAGEPLLPIIAVSIDGVAETATYELGEMDKYQPGRQTLVARETAANQRQMRAPAGGRLR